MPELSTATTTVQIIFFSWQNQYNAIYLSAECKLFRIPSLPAALGTSHACVGVLSLRSRVFHGFVTELWYSRHVLFSCEHARLRLCSSRALSQLRMFGSRHSCLEIRFSCRGSDTRDPFSVIVWVRGVSLDCALSCPRVFCCVARSSCFYRLHAFMLYLVLCGTQLVYFIGCVPSCCHVLCEHVAHT